MKQQIPGERVLRLTLRGDSKKEAPGPYPVMVTGEKNDEFRRPSKWIISRLIDSKTGLPKHYDRVEFTNGYAKTSPRFSWASYGGFTVATEATTHTFSNGLVVQVEPGDYIIHRDVPLAYYCDNYRHLVCYPYSRDNLHRMAFDLGLVANWFEVGKNKAHYDIPKQRIAEIQARCTLVRPRDILNIIGGQAPPPVSFKS